MTPYVKAIVPEDRGGIITLHVQEFMKGADSSLLHVTDGNLRASVPSEGWTDYAELWPAAKPVIAYLRSGGKTLKAKRR